MAVNNDYYGVGYDYHDDDDYVDDEEEDNTDYHTLLNMINYPYCDDHDLSMWSDDNESDQSMDTIDEKNEFDNTDRKKWRMMLEDDEGDMQHALGQELYFETWIRYVKNDLLVHRERRFDIHPLIEMLEEHGYQHLGLPVPFTTMNWFSNTHESIIIPMVKTYIRRYGSLVGFWWAWVGPRDHGNAVSSELQTDVMYNVIDNDLLSSDDRKTLFCHLISARYCLFQQPCNFANRIVRDGFVNTMAIKRLLSPMFIFNVMDAALPERLEAIDTMFTVLCELLCPISAPTATGKQLFQHIIDFSLFQANNRLVLMKYLIDCRKANPNTLIPIRMFMRMVMDIAPLEIYYQSFIVDPEYVLPHSYEDERWTIGERNPRSSETVEGWTVLHMLLYDRSDIFESFEERLDYLLHEGGANTAINIAGKK